MTPRSRRYGFEPEKFIPYLKRLMEERDETSYRQTALDAGLDRSAVWRFVEKGTRPHRDACILLGQHFRVGRTRGLGDIVSCCSERGHFEVGTLDRAGLDGGVVPVDRLASDVEGVDGPSLRGQDVGFTARAENSSLAWNERRMTDKGSELANLVLL